MTEVSDKRATDETSVAARQRAADTAETKFLFQAWLVAAALGIVGGIIDDFGAHHTANVLYMCAGALSVFLLMGMSGMAEDRQKRK